MLICTIYLLPLEETYICWNPAMTTYIHCYRVYPSNNTENNTRSIGPELNLTSTRTGDGTVFPTGNSYPHMQDRRSVTPRPPNSNTLLGRHSGQILRREMCKLRVRSYDSVEYPALLVKAKTQHRLSSNSSCLYN